MDPIGLTNNSVGGRIAVTGTSQRVAISGYGDSLVISNLGDCDAYIALGDSSIVAVLTSTTAGYPIFAGAKEDEILIPPDASWRNAPYIAAICASGETTVITAHRVFR
jgi:hypothetical protein